MGKKSALFIVLIAFSVLFSQLALAQCCINQNSVSFCSDSTAEQCCGSPADPSCVAQYFLEGTSCQNTGYCFDYTENSCCIDSCITPTAMGKTSPLVCSNPDFFVMKNCAEYSECAFGCAFCSGDTGTIGFLEFFRASGQCVGRGLALSMFNTSAESSADCTGMVQTTTVLYNVSGTVIVSGTGAPIAGASVTVAGKTVATNAQGYFIATYLPVGNFTIRAWHNDYYEAISYVNVDGNKAGIVIALNPIPKANLLVEVRSFEGQPVSGASVTADGFSASTNDAGVADFGELPMFSPNGLQRFYTITASFGTAQNSTMSNLTSPSKTVTITLPQVVEGTGAINGYILNSTGGPVSGAVVSVAGQQFTSLGTGFYQFTNLAAGSYQISIAPPSPYFMKTATVVVEADATKQYNFTVVMPEAEQTAALKVSVVESSDPSVPVQGANVSFTQQGAAIPSLILVTGSDGIVIATLQNQTTYTVRARKAGYSDSTWTVTLDGDKNITLPMSKEVTAGYTVSGTVKDSFDGSPIGGAYVRIASGIFEKHAVTDPDGQYSIANIPPLASYQIFAGRQGYVQVSEIFMMPANNIQKNFSLQQAECYVYVTPPEITGASVQKNKTVITFETPCAITGYYVYRCKGEGCTDMKPITNMISPAIKQFTDEAVEPETWYTYEIHGYFEEPKVQKQASEPVSIYTGAKECFELKTSEFCHNNVRSKCDANNTIVTVEAAEGQYHCVQAGQATKYVEKIDCDTECNLPLGMFSALGKFLVTFAAGKESVPCSDVSLFSPLSYCYEDYARTVVSRYYACGEIDSCYGYFSRGACEADNCGLSEPEGCVWRTYSDDLSLGVCMPKAAEKWNCSRCNPSDKFNNLFGTCNENICDLYGGEVDNNGNALSHYCYFNKVSKKCEPKEVLGCEHYGKSAEQCLGGGPNVSVHIAGDNRILQRSNDLLGFGLCRFGTAAESLFSNKCFKDANNDFSQDFNHTDMTPPYTSVMHPTASNSINFPFIVYDDEDKRTAIASGAETYFQIAPVPGAFIRPTVLAEGGVISFAGLTESNKNYTVWFYSKDRADNLEVVKGFNVYIDLIPPEIGFTYSYYDSSGTLLVSILPSESVTCSAWLTQGGSVVQPDKNIVEELGASFSVSYENVPDGVYYYRYECLDWVGNNVSKNNLIVIDTERMIYDLQPNGTIRYASQISARTMANANCRYIDADPGESGSFDFTTLENVNFNAMTPFANTGGTLHTSPISINSTSIAKLYLVRCMLAETGNLTRSNFSAVSFVVDRLPPETNFYEAYDVTTDIPFNFSIWRKQANFKLKCKDPPSPVTDPFPNYMGPREFGCELLYHCSGYGSCTPQPAYINYTVDGQLMQANATQAGVIINETKMFCYYSVDKGGNFESEKCTMLRIDNTEPRVRITGIDAGAKCTDFAGIPVCRINRATIALNGTVDNAAYWSDQGGMLPYFTNFTLNATILSSNVAEINFDYFPEQNFYDYVQLNFLTKQVTYGKVGDAETKGANIFPNTPIELSINAIGENAEIRINNELVGTFARINEGGWIKADSPTPQTFSNILVMDETATSGIVGDSVSVVVNGISTGQAIPIENGQFSADVDISPLLAQISPEGIVEIQAIDEAGNIGKAMIFAVIDTVGPTSPPKFDPPIDKSQNVRGENYDLLGYPVNYEAGDGIYYIGATEEGKLYISGFTPESGTTLEMWRDGADNVANYTQPSSESYSTLAGTFKAAFTAKKGQSQVAVTGDFVQTIQQLGEKYATFTGHHRTAYGHYDEAYEITGVQFETGKGTVLSLAYPLEKDVVQDEVITISNMVLKPDRFAFWLDIGTEPYGTGMIQLYQFDDVGNTGVPSEQINYVLDSVSPINGSVTPSIKTGRVPSIPNITVEIVEQGTGLREDNIIFTINGQPHPMNVTKTSQSFDNNTGYTITYRLFYNYQQSADGVYNIRLKVTDKANNPIEFAWNLTVDTQLPRNPDFTVTNGVNISVDPDGYTYVTGVPEVKASYVELDQPDGIVEIASVQARKTYPPLETALYGASCVREGFSDTFRCTIELDELPGDGDYELKLWPAKVFADGTSKVKQTPDIFSFVLDTKPPTVKNFRIISKFITSQSGIDFSAKVENETHRLKATLVLEDHTKTPTAHYTLFSTLSALPESLFKGHVSNETIINAMLFQGMTLRDSETYTIRINVSDYAGNINDTEMDTITIDDTPPVIYPHNIIINATPLYQYTYPGITEEGETVVYIVREDVISIHGIVPNDVAELSFYRITGKGEEFIASLSPCLRETDTICVRNDTGAFRLESKKSIVYGQLGQVINNLIRIVAKDRAGNRAETAKLIYADMETPSIIICTAVECTEYVEETPPITDPAEMKTICGTDITCYDFLVKGACTEDKILDKQCYSNFVSTELSKEVKDRSLSILCKLVETYTTTCIMELAKNICSYDVCDDLTDSNMRTLCISEVKSVCY